MLTQWPLALVFVSVKIPRFRRQMDAEKINSELMKEEMLLREKMKERAIRQIGAVNGNFKQNAASCEKAASGDIKDTRKGFLLSNVGIFLFKRLTHRLVAYNIRMTQLLVQSA
jgi:hypothetical protein